MSAPLHDLTPSLARSASVERLASTSRRAERRLRLRRALDLGVKALCGAFVVAALTLALRKTGHLAEGSARATLALAALLTLTAPVVGYLLSLPTRAGAVALDRYHALSDRLSSALSFAELRPEARTPFMELAILDAVSAAATANPRRAVPLRMPRDLPMAALLGAATLAIALFEVRRHEVVVAAKTIDAVDVTADDLDAMRDFLKTIEQKDTSEATKAATEEFNQLISDLAAKRLDRTEAFRKMQALEDKLLLGSEADHKAMEAALAKIGEEMKKAELTRPAGAALTGDHLADAEKELRALADRLRQEASHPGGTSKEQLAKMREALKKASEENAKQQQSIAERREELRQSLLKEKAKAAADAGANEEEKSLLQKKERELERLEKEQEAAAAAGRQLDRLDRELAQAAEDLMKDLGASAEDLEKGAEDINRMAQSEMTEEEKEQLKQKIEELREMVRQQGQGGKQQMVRLRRFQAGAQGQGQGQGQGQEGQGEGEGQEGQGGQKPGQGQGQNGQGQNGQGQNGQGPKSQGQAQNSQGQSGQAQGGQGQGSSRAPGSGGETWIVGPNGEKILMISRGQGQGGGEGQGQGNGGDGKDGSGRNSWGTGHDEHVQGQAHGIKSGTQDTQVAGQDTGQGGSRSEVIQGAAERGFASHGYQKVFREYHTVAEEALNKDEIPGGYRAYIRRYFELIRPRETK